MDIKEMLESSGLGSIRDAKGETFNDFLTRMKKESENQMKSSGLASGIIADKGDVKGGPTTGPRTVGDLLKEIDEDLFGQIDKGASSLLRAEGIPGVFERMTKDSRNVLFQEVKKAADEQKPEKVTKIMSNIAIIDEIAKLVKRLTIVK